MPRLADGGKKRPPAAAAVPFRLDPFGLAGPRVQDTLVGLVASEGLLAAGAMGRGSGGLRVTGRLAGQGVVEHLFAEDLTDFEEQVFDLRQFGAPRGAVRSIELVDQVFCYALDVGTDFFGLLSTLRGSRHPWTLSAVAAKT